MRKWGCDTQSSMTAPLSAHALLFEKLNMQMGSDPSYGNRNLRQNASSKHSGKPRKPDSTGTQSTQSQRLSASSQLPTNFLMIRTNQKSHICSLASLKMSPLESPYQQLPTIACLSLPFPVKFPNHCLPNVNDGDCLSSFD